MALHTRESAGEPPTSLPAAIAGLTGTTPAVRVGAESRDRLFAAIWRFPCTLEPITLSHPSTSTLAFQRAGTPTITRVVEGKRLRKRPKIGSLTYVPQGVPATWESDRPCEQVHVYIDSGVLERFVSHESSLPAVPEIDDFFATCDPWLAGYFQMLIGEYDLLSEGGRGGDTLLLDQTECLLVRHLIRWHSNARRGARSRLDRKAGVAPLQPVLTRRVQDYVDANLAGELHLCTLADLACMSVDHFLRAFRAATGTTPYRYVLEQRLHRAREMLSSSDACISAVARRCGFQSISHFSATFHASFGVSPSRYRKRKA